MASPTFEMRTAMQSTDALHVMAPRLGAASLGFVRRMRIIDEFSYFRF
jgi:hypothetical protein